MPLSVLPGLPRASNESTETPSFFTEITDSDVKLLKNQCSQVEEVKTDEEIDEQQANTSLELNNPNTVFGLMISRQEITPRLSRDVSPELRRLLEILRSNRSNISLQ